MAQLEQAVDTDQTELYSRKKWVNVGFTEPEINSDPELRTTTVRG
ncbi:hypothetical protein OHA25_38605 [Nonomuraea sp. NBC_00507]